MVGWFKKVFDEADAQKAERQRKKQEEITELARKATREEIDRIAREADENALPPAPIVPVEKPIEILPPGTTNPDVPAEDKKEETE